MRKKNKKQKTSQEQFKFIVEKCQFARFARQKLSENQEENIQNLNFSNHNSNFDSKRTFLTCIESVNFPNCFLRADKPPKNFQPHGSGVVNVQFGARSLEIWKVHKFSFNEKNVFAFEMLMHQNVFLRFSPGFGGVNTLNLINQNPEKLTDFEKWELVNLKDGKFGIKNCGFPFLYLSMNGENISKKMDHGSGIVSLVQTCGNNEQFYVSGFY
eukprot:TRINITY_DN2186_c0_g1_i2.p2 TRINITY_DN2186_c0_g1~~TRINITY_DN2186_c0_g1_i2.p2  ORF type:complete len:213 (+),score=34.01 TRINITY_DN2186_c0_g1_i2:622-1260(+)